jgi:hypothetical protein
MSHSDTTPTDDNGTDMESISLTRTETAELHGGVMVHSGVEVGHLPNPMAEYLDGKARQFEALFQMLLGRDGDEITQYDTVGKDPLRRDTVELESFVELDADQGQYTFAVEVARRIEAMFKQEHRHLSERVSDEVDDEEVFVPPHKQYTSL